MQPRRFHFGRDIFLDVLFVQIDQPVHLRSHMIRRAVFVNRSVLTNGIVGLLFVFALDERDFALLSELIYRGRGFLILQQSGVQLFDIRSRNTALVGDEIEQSVDDEFVIANYERGFLRRLLAGAVMDQGENAEFDECFSDAAIERVDALDQSGFDGPFAAHFFIEFLPLARGFDFDLVFLLFPDFRQGTKLFVRKRSPVGFVIRQRSPFV